MWYLYKHTNKINNKVYIGKTENWQKRWEHNGCHYKTCPRFWSAIQHYGWDNFYHDIIFETDDESIINLKEKEYIEKYQSTNSNYGYNLAIGGAGGDVWKGKTQEEKKKYSEQRREETLSRGIEWHQKLSEAQLAHWHSPQGDVRRENIKNKMLGSKNHQAKKCKCVELDKIFDSYADACDYLNQPRKYSSKIGQVIRGEHHTFASYHWEAVV